MSAFKADDCKKSFFNAAFFHNIQKGKNPWICQDPGIFLYCVELCYFDQKRGGFTTSKTAVRPGFRPE